MIFVDDTRTFGVAAFVERVARITSNFIGLPCLGKYLQQQGVSWVALFHPGHERPGRQQREFGIHGDRVRRESEGVDQIACGSKGVAQMPLPGVIV